MTKKARGFLLFTVILIFCGGAYLALKPSARSGLSENHPAFENFAKIFHSVNIENPPSLLPQAYVETAPGVFESLPKIDSGKIRVINVWATWCPPCIKELPSLAKFQAQHPDIKVILLSYDLQKSHEELTAFTEKHGAGGLPVISDSRLELRRILPFTVLPSTLIINEKGQVLYTIKGEGDWTSPSVTDFFKAFMGSSNHELQP